MVDNNKPTVTILYSTQSGRAKACARRSSRLLRSKYPSIPIRGNCSFDEFGVDVKFTAKDMSNEYHTDFEYSPPTSCSDAKEDKKEMEAKAQPVKVPGGPFQTISAGGTHTCAITRGGEAVCWGGNVRGQVGDGTTEARPSPTPVTTR